MHRTPHLKKNISIIIFLPGKTHNLLGRNLNPYMRAALVLIVAGLFVTIANAQETTGGLTGRVHSDSGVPLEGASVVITGAPILVSTGTSSDATGSFHLNRLPVGQYRLEITSVGHNTAVIDKILVGLGPPIYLGVITLSEKSLELAEVLVTDSRSYLTTTSEVGGTLQQSTLETLAVDRDFKSAISLLPSVATSYYGDQANMGGATGSENLFFIDGINVTENYDVATSISIPYNFIREVQVKQGGYDARYGRTYGGLINAVTESGTNEFRASAFSFYTNSALGQKPKTDGAPGSTTKNYQNYDVGFSAGGALIKDKLWYFAAFNHKTQQREREIVGHGFFLDKRTTNMFAAKLNWQVSRTTNVSLSVIGDPTSADQVLNADFLGNVPTVVINPDALLPRFKSGGIYSIISGMTVTESNWHFDYAIFGYSRRLNETGQTDQATNLPQFTDMSNPEDITTSGGIGWHQDTKMWKYGAQASVNKQIKSSSLSAGFSLEANRASVLQYSDGINNGYIQLYDPTPVYFTGNFYFIPEVPMTVNPSAFLHNTWRKENVEILMGLRWDGWMLTNHGNNLQSMQLLQPRIGISYFMGAESKHKVFGSYGLYYQQLPLFATTGYFTHTERADFYNQDPRNAGAIPFTQINFVPVDEPDYQKVKHLKPDYLSEFNLGYETLITQFLRLSLKGVYRSLENAFITGYTPEEKFIVGNAGTGSLSFLPPVKRVYKAVELQLRGTALSGKLDLNFSYLLSSNYGNYTGYFDQDLRLTSQPGGSASYAVAEQAVNATGYMPNDRRHIVKAFASYAFKFGLTVGVSASYMTGTPLNEFKPDTISTYRFTFLVPRGTAGRLPNIFDFNLRMAYSTSKFPVKIYLDLLHVGSKQTVVAVNQLKYSDPYATIPNPTFGQPLAYAPPMFLRVGLEFKLKRN